MVKKAPAFLNIPTITAFGAPRVLLEHTFLNIPIQP
eukprot:gene14017-4111_t